MKFTLLVNCAPHSKQGALTALKFAQSCLSQGHQLTRVFFYGDGVHAGTQLAVTPQGEIDLINEWQQLQKQHKIELAVCIAAALKRGVIDADEANRYERKTHNLHPCFELTGLGQLIESCAYSDRVVTFG